MGLYSKFFRGGGGVNNVCWEGSGWSEACFHKSYSVILISLPQIQIRAWTGNVEQIPVHVYLTRLQVHVTLICAKCHAVAIVSTGQGKQAYNCISNPLIINIIRFGIFSKVVLFSYSRTFLKNEMQCMLLTMRFNFAFWDIQVPITFIVIITIQQCGYLLVNQPSVQ